MSINRRLPDEITTLLNAAGTRRAFLRNSAVTAVTVGTLAACKAAGQETQGTGVVQDSDHSGGTTAPHPANPAAAIAMDGWPQPAPWKCDTLNVAPGERWDVIVNCNNPGVWAFHCHVLPHAESQHGMFGMVTALIVEK